jgi:hypothetical protein
MKSLLLAAVASILFLEGCSTAMRPVKAVPESELTVGNNVTILRNYNYIGGGIRYWPTVDGSEVSGLFPNQHISVQLQPGKHKLGVRCGFGSDELEVEIKGNDDHHYYKISPNLFSMINPFLCGEIEAISKAEADHRLEKSRQIKTGYLSDCTGRSVLFESHPDYTCLSYAIP